MSLLKMSEHSESEIDTTPLLHDPGEGHSYSKGQSHVEAASDGVIIEEVALTVSTVDDPSLPVWTFRTWTLGLISCVILSYLNTFFGYRTEPLTVTAISAQIAALPVGHFMAATLPNKIIAIPFTTWRFSLNPGPFNVKEHVLITIFANAGSGFGSGPAYAIGIVNIVKAFYRRSISFVACLLLVLTTQVLGYGWAGLLRKYLVEPAHMWWPSNLVQVSIFRTLHEKDQGEGISRSQFFLMCLVASFVYYTLPGYFLSTLTSISWICLIWPKSVTAQQIGSGLYGLGLGAFSFDWAGMSAYLGSPLVSPLFAIINAAVGFIVILYIVMPITYWGNVYNAKTFPLFSSNLFTGNGQPYNISAIVNDNFQLDINAYNSYGKLHMSTFFAITYGIGFAAITATVTHVMLFHGKEIWNLSRAALHDDHPDIHTRLMRRYPDIPHSWFLILAIAGVGVSIATCEIYKKQLQLPWWAVILACAMASVFTLPIGVLTATANQTPGLNVLSEYIIGYVLPGQPIANVCFKTYGYISMSQAISFLQDFKLGHYMKIPPRSMFIVQVIGTIVAGIINLVVAWWMLTIPNICDIQHLPPGSPWTCPNDRVFFDASVIWGLVGPKRIFGPSGLYRNMNWFFLGGALAPIPVWLLSKAFPRVKWIPLINVPIMLNGAGVMPPATAVNLTSWVLAGLFFNWYVFEYHKEWWQRYNYVLSAAFDAGTAFMGVVLYFSLGINNKTLNWWGNHVDHCPLAQCPTAPGIVVAGCPVF
ncbi:hypothetical protein O6H91_01G057000 [Diphasiastrum complanatum]|uniref:Uncharacterized protein n=1 Tax=Diphasiastrum complanatum TaxID=34168 RepID=A0ACC2ER89_DIPCM|nr:hypothetical protein O6H91_01G057000 [Diphasiastrum complanatum]